MCRTRSIVAAATPIASSNYKSVIARQETLRAGHVQRVQELSSIVFTARSSKPHRRGRAYTYCWGHKIFATEEIILGAKMALHYE